MGETLGFALRLTEENKAEVTEKEEKERMRKNQIGTLFIVSALALSGVGMSYAMWSETIVMSGNVTVGSLDFEWSVEAVGDDEIAGKDVSGITATTSENTMTVTIYNAYPCITYSLWFDIHCIGTVPVHFQNFVLDTQAQAWAAAGILTIISDPLYPNQQPDITKIQLHQNDEWYGLLTFHFDNDDGFTQETTYTFEVSLFGYQYNEPCNGQFPSKVLDIPEGIVNAVFAHPGSQSYWGTTLSNVPDGYDVDDGLYVGWCVDEDSYIVPGPSYVYTMELYSSYDPANPYPDTDWPKVNYIINHKQGTADDIQEAIWHYINHGPYTGSDPDVLAMIADADANGAFFVPGTGQWCAVVLIANPGYQHGYNVQPTFIEVDP